MTHKQWLKMTPDERRIKIANLLGIEEVREADYGTCAIEDIGSWGGKYHGIPVDVPDYCDDLNAMWDALVKREDTLPAVYWPILYNVLGAVLRDHTSDWAIHTATAAQRAEALVLTLEPEET